MDSEYTGQKNSNLYSLDFIVIAFYFIGILSVGFWCSARSSRNTVMGYFLSDKSMHWIPVGSSLFATTVGSASFVGLAGAGANSGLGIASIELHAMYIILILGWYFVPVYLSSGVKTMPEYMGKRFGGQRIRIYLSVMSLFILVFMAISVDLYSGALFIKQALNLNMYISVIILVGISAVLTISGGLTAVLWTDFVQTIIMFVGAVLLMVLSLSEVGGYTNLIESFASKAEPTDSDFIAYRDGCIPINKTCISCSSVTKYYKNLLRPPNDPELPSTGLLTGLTVSAIWFWCSNQATVQRALSSKNISHAKAGCILCAFLKIFNVFLIVLTGMAARVLWPNEVGCSNPDKCKAICGSENGCSNIAYPLLVLRLMPKGATGLMLSVMMAALMSSLTSVFNSASTIFTIDIYSRFRKNASELEQVFVGRVFILFSMIVSILWIPIIQSSHESQLFHYIQSLISFLAPPVCAVYILGISWSRINEKGAFWALMVGLIIGLIRFVMEFAYTIPTCASGDVDPRPFLISKVHYWHFGAILLLISSVIAIVVSLLTDPIDENKLYRLTFNSRFSKEVRNDLNEESNKLEIKTDSKPKNRINNFDINENLVKNKFLNYVCCIGSDNRTDEEINNKELSLTKEEEAVKSGNDAKEEPFWRSLNNTFAILVIVFASFIWGFYA